MHSQFASISPGIRLQANSVTFENLNFCDLFCRLIVAGVPVKFQWSFRNRQSQECQEIHLWTWNYELSVQSWARSWRGWTGRGGRSGQSHAANPKFVIPTKSLYIMFEWLTSTLVSGKACNVVLEWFLVNFRSFVSCPDQNRDRNLLDTPLGPPKMPTACSGSDPSLPKSGAQFSNFEQNSAHFGRLRRQPCPCWLVGIPTFWK